MRWSTCMIVKLIRRCLRIWNVWSECILTHCVCVEDFCASAGLITSPNLVQIGPPTSEKKHRQNSPSPKINDTLLLLRLLYSYVLPILNSQSVQRRPIKSIGLSVVGSSPGMKNWPDILSALPWFLQGSVSAKFWARFLTQSYLKHCGFDMMHDIGSFSRHGQRRIYRCTLEAGWHHGSVSVGPLSYCNGNRDFRKWLVISHTCVALIVIFND